MISAVTIKDAGSFEYTDERYGCGARANFVLHIISLAWCAGCNLEDLADGFGAGCGTMGGDWSGIRDSSDEATGKMFERASNFIQEKLAA